MTAHQKSNIKMTIGCITGIITIIIFAFSLGVGFAGNTAEHDAIKVDLVAVRQADEEETKRSKMTDKATANDISKIQLHIGIIQTTLTDVSKTTERIEKKIDK